MTLKAYHVSWAREYAALAWAETRNKARAMASGFYSRPEEEVYVSILAWRLSAMDAHPLAPSKPCIMDGYQGHPEEVALIEASRIYYCPRCGGDYDEEGCICD